MQYRISHSAKPTFEMTKPRNRYYASGTRLLKNFPAFVILKPRLCEVEGYCVFIDNE